MADPLKELPDCDRLLTLMTIALISNGGFGMLAPEEIRKDREALKADDALQRFGNSMWEVEFRNGCETQVTLRELVVLLYNYTRIAGELNGLNLEDPRLITDSVLHQLSTNLVYTVTVDDAKNILRRLVEGD